MKMTRRDLLRFAAGSAAGLLFTPVPWKLLDDSAIWTQNWPWIPEPSDGERSIKISACTLCGAGCGLRAHCVNGIPVRLSGNGEQPLGKGFLCAAGLTAHHLAYHPLRLRQPIRRLRRGQALGSSPISFDEAIATITGAIGSDSVVAVLDRRPGRTISRVYRQWLGSLRHGLYLTPPPVEGGTLETLRTLVDGRPELGFDFEHTGTIVSFGTPLADGWGSPGRMMPLIGSRRLTSAPSIIQIEPRYSRTSMVADSWIPITPGTETTLALALLEVIREEKRARPDDLRKAMTVLSPNSWEENALALQAYSPNQASRVTGVPAGQIVSLSRSISSSTPTIVIAGGDAGAGPMKRATQQAVAALNIALGSVGKTGGIVSRSHAGGKGDKPVSSDVRMSLTDLPDRSIDLLILDAAEDGCAIPWQIVERKLRSDKALVVSLSPFLSGLSCHADLIIPSPAPLEGWEEIPTPFDAPTASFALSVPLMTPPEGTTDPAHVMQQISLGTGGGIDGRSGYELLKNRVAEILSLGRGEVRNGNVATPANSIASADAMWDLLASGGVWFDNVASVPLKVGTNGGSVGDVFADKNDEVAGHQDAAQGIVVSLLPFGTKAIADTGQVSPILSKLFQESSLRPSNSSVFVNPSTSDRCGLHGGESVRITTDHGTITATLHADESIMPGAAFFPVGPDPESINQGPGTAPSLLALCVETSGTWRVTKATLEKA